MDAYQAMKGEIEAAERELAPYLPVLDALLDDVDALLEHAARLFAEPAFKSMWFTAADVHRAFEAVGYPATPRPDEGDAAILGRAIEVLSPEPWRVGAAARLVRLLPECVAAGRHLDAALLRFCALRLLETPEQANPFTMEMFDHGLREWTEQVEAQRTALLQEMGLNRSAIAGYKPDQIRALIDALMADPAAKRRLEAALAPGTVLGDQAEGAAGEQDRDIFLLLERPDARRLLLSEKEIAPWLEVLAERMAPLEEEMRQARNEGRAAAPELRTAIGRAMHDTALEMAPALLTPARLWSLAADLDAYRRELIAARAKEASAVVRAAYSDLLAEENPAGSRIVFAICLASLHRAVLRAGEEEGA